MNHTRSGELVAVSHADRWFSYYYWLDDARALDFARTVDIHRKPGYDPVELFVDPELFMPKLSMAFKLAKRKLGMRNLLDVISLKDYGPGQRLARPPDGRPGRWPPGDQFTRGLVAGRRRSRHRLQTTGARPRVLVTDHVPDMNFCEARGSANPATAISAIFFHSSRTTLGRQVTRSY